VEIGCQPLGLENGALGDRETMEGFGDPGGQIRRSV
jgi:hypothetical protein